MKNIEKKWSLFLVATFVCGTGIICSLIKKTQALEEISNAWFDDVNFYKCVVDSYNRDNNTNIEYTASLTDEELSSISNLDCYNNDTIAFDKISSTKGIEKLTSLVSLSMPFNLITSIDISKNDKLEKINLANNKLTEIDVSNNLNLTYLEIVGNQISNLDLSRNTELIDLNSGLNLIDGIFNIYKGDSVTIEKAIKYPENIDLSLSTWLSNDEDVVSVNSNGVVTSLSGGTAVVSMSVKDNVINYRSDSLINVIDIVSDSYVINKENDYVYVGIKEFNKDNISVVGYDVIEDNNQLQIVDSSNTVIKKLDILGLDFGKLSVENNTIKIKNDLLYDNFVKNISISDKLDYKFFNGNKEVTSGNITNGMKLVIYYENEEIDSYDIKDNMYNLSFDSSLAIDSDNKYIKYLNVGTTVEKILENVSVTNGLIYLFDKNGSKKIGDSLVATGDVLKVYFKDELMDEYIISVKGDCNGDAKINFLDLSLIKKHFVGWKDPDTKIKFELTDVYKESIDCNGDGKIDLLDVSLLSNLIAGLS